MMHRGSYFPAKSIGIYYCARYSSKRSVLDIKTRIMPELSPKKHSDERFITHPAFPHEPWENEDCEAVKFLHREPTTRLDNVAYKAMLYSKQCFNFVTGYKKPITPEEQKTRFKGTRYEMTANKWLTRVIFLESVAGVPGMVAAFIRHLHSLRLLQRDKAWIETLLDEAYNERMHLLTFMKIGEPSWFMRFFVYMGQGVFVNIFFFMYLLSPRYCHRFVGYLEEEAVSTYTHLINELKAKNLPEFDNITIPTIAQSYWPELNEKSTFFDLIQRVRADESKHREVNHTLANLDQKADRNPYALKVPDVSQPQPEYGLKSEKKCGWERKDLIL